MKNKLLQICAVIVFAFATLTTAAQSWNLTGNSGTAPGTNFIGTKDNKAFVFKTNNIERMRINNIGYLGIGTNSPQAMLHVNNGSFVNLSSPGCIQIGSTNSTNIGMDYSAIQARWKGYASRLYLNYFGGEVWMGAHNADPTPAIFIAEDGTVGIGTSSTSLYALQVNSTSDLFGGIYSVNDGTGNGIFAQSNYATAIVGSSTNGYGVHASANNNNGLYAATGNNASYYAGYFIGDVYSSTGVFTGSDQKLKQNIHDFKSAMDIINQLQPKQYQFRQDGNYKLMNLPQGNHYGLIAQDVEKILPNLIKGSKFDVDKATTSKPSVTKNASAQNDKKSDEVIDFKALNYTELIPIIIKGMQELNENLQQQIQQEQQRIDKLEKLIEKLSVTSNTSSSKLSSENSSAYLKQNTPNPFTQNTTIYCNLPSSAKQAQLIIYNQNGIQIKSFDLTSGINDITISAGSLSSGEYVYSLFIDGKNIDSKKMILTK
jgi:hypothetical protein